MNYGAAAPANMRKIIRFKKYETDNFAKKPIERAAGPILDMRKAQHNTKNGAIFALFAISGPARHFVRTGFAVFWSWPRAAASRQDRIPGIPVFPGCRERQGYEN